jgi:hypothetical protein
METGKAAWLNTSDSMVRYKYHQNFIDQSESTTTIFKKDGEQLLHVRTNEDYVKILQQFFTRRKKTH